jgi:hypothetical protein
MTLFPWAVRCGIVLFVIPVMAGCGGGGGGASANPTATPAALCTVGSSATLALVSPAPGSTNVSTNVTTLYVAASGAIPAGPNLEIETSAGVVTSGNYGLQEIAGANALPSGSATPPFSAAAYYSVSGFVLTGGTTYTVYLINAAQSGCTPSPIGSATFST